MVSLRKNFILLVMLFATFGCTTYNIPIQTDNHPTSTNTKVSQIELSSILDISERNNCEKSDIDDH